MKIAISATGTNQDAQVDPRFGRTKWFIVHDTTAGAYEAVDNKQQLDLPQGAGIQAAQKVLDEKVEVVLTGHCGPNAFKTLKAGGAKVVVGVSGTVAEAVERFNKGELTPSTEPDVVGHW